MFRKPLAVLVIVALAAIPFVASCRAEPPSGDPPGGDPGPIGTGGDPGGPVTIGDGPATGLAAAGAVAVGPFTNLRSSGWTATGLAWGWGDVSETTQLFFTAATDGTIRSIELATALEVASATPLPDGSGFIGMHYSDMTGWFHPLEGEAVCLGHTEALLLSPAGDRVLVIAREGVVAYDTATWTPVPLMGVPGGSFPFAGINLEWVGDDLVAVRQWDRGGDDPHRSRIEIVSLADGQGRATLASADGILSPLPSPDGRWLAVLVIDPAQAVVEPEASFPTDAGRELRLYSVESLAAATESAGPASGPEPAGVLAAEDGKVFSFLNWSPDGSALFFAETSASVVESFGQPSLRYEPDGRVGYWSPGSDAHADASPGFGRLPLPADGSWVPFGLSPGGRYLKVGDAISLDEFLWDLTASREVRLPEGVDPGSLRWFSDGLVGARLWDPDGRPTPGVLVDIPTGHYQEVAWGRQIYTPSPGASHVAVQVPARDAAAGLGPFETLPEGEWLVILPVR